LSESQSGRAKSSGISTKSQTKMSSSLHIIPLHLLLSCNNNNR